MRSPGVHTARTPPASRLSRICAQIVLFLPLRLRTAAKAAAPEETSSSPQPALCVSRMRTSPGAMGAAHAGISGSSSAALASPPSASAGDADPAPRFPERRISAWGISETESGSAQWPLRGTGWGASGWGSPDARPISPCPRGLAANVSAGHHPRHVGPLARERRPVRSTARDHVAVGKVRLSAFPRGGVASLFFSPTAPCGRERVHANVCTNSLDDAYEIPRIQHFVAYKIGRFVRFLGSFWKRGLRSCTAHRAVAGGPGAEGASAGRQTCRGGDRRRVPSLGDTAGRQRPAQGRPLPPVRDVAACVLTPAGPAGLHGVPRACLTDGAQGGAGP